MIELLKFIFVALYYASSIFALIANIAQPIWTALAGKSRKSRQQ